MRSRLGNLVPMVSVREDYIRRVHQFDPADAITAAMVPHLERKVYGLMDDAANVLKSMHRALLEALRHREQEIFSYPAILVLPSAASYGFFSRVRTRMLLRLSLPGPWASS